MLGSFKMQGAQVQDARIVIPCTSTRHVTFGWLCAYAHGILAGAIATDKLRSAMLRVALMCLDLPNRLQAPYFQLTRCIPASSTHNMSVSIPHRLGVKAAHPNMRAEDPSGCNTHPEYRMARVGWKCTACTSVRWPLSTATGSEPALLIRAIA